MKKVIKVVSVIGFILAIILFYYAYKYQIFSDPKVLQKFIKGFGSFGIVIFILMQIIQPVIPIIPGGLSDVAGILMYGKAWGLFYVCFGLVIGEIIMFFLVKKYGVKFLQQFLAQKTLDKIHKIVNSNNNMQKLIILTFLMPFGPDDLVCMAAGLSNLSFKKYFWTITLLKPISVGVHCFIMISIFKVVKI